MLDKAWLWFIVIIFVIGSILSASMDKVPVGTSYGSQSTLNYITDIKNVSYKTNTAGQATFVLFNTEYFNTWGKVLSWDYSFLDNNDYADMFKYIVLYPITLVTMAMFAAMFTWMLSNIFGH